MKSGSDDGRGPCNNRSSGLSAPHSQHESSGPCPAESSPFLAHPPLHRPLPLVPPKHCEKGHLHCPPNNPISAVVIRRRRANIGGRRSAAVLGSSSPFSVKEPNHSAAIAALLSSANLSLSCKPPQLLLLLICLLCFHSYAPPMLAQAASAHDGQHQNEAEIQPRLAVFREIGDRLSGESDEDAIYEEVEYYLEEEEPMPTPPVQRQAIIAGKGQNGDNALAALMKGTNNGEEEEENKTEKNVAEGGPSMGTEMESGTHICPLPMCLKPESALPSPRIVSIPGRSPQETCSIRVLHLLILLLFSLLSMVRPIQTRSSPTSDTEILSQLLNRGYDWRVRPPGTNLSLHGDHGPVVVNINMLIRSISKIDDVNMEYSAQLTFREEWVDGRLAYGLPKDNRPDHIILTAGQQIWMPDTFFQNEKQARKHEIDKPNVLIRIYKDGRILYSVRISLVLSCPMYLEYYPMDIQTCLIDMASYAYTDSDIEYRWKEEKPVQLKEGLESSLPSFQLTNVSTGYCTSKTNTGTYSCLSTILTLRRQFSYYLLQLYIPSSMLVIVSWVSFWLDRTAVPARVTLGVTTLLTMTTQTSGINAKLPPVSYSKAIDIWCGACLAFIFSALLEFACVTYISSRMFYKSRGRGNARMLGRTGLPIYSNNSRPSLRRQSVCPHCRFEMPVTMGQRPSLRYTPLSGPQYLDEESEEVWVRRKEMLPPGVPPLALPHTDTRKGSILDKESLMDHNEMSLDRDRDRLSSPSVEQSKSQKRPNFVLALLRRMPPIRWLHRRLDAEVDPAKRADYISRILFPLVFVVFNLAYWVRYLKL